MSLDSPSPILPLEQARCLSSSHHAVGCSHLPIGTETSAGAISDARLVSSAVCCISAAAREYRDSHVLDVAPGWNAEALQVRRVVD